MAGISCRRGSLAIDGYRRRAKPIKAETARRFRANPARGEAELWDALKWRGCAGLKFRRQSVILGWIADFWCPAKRLVVEVDGGYHKDRQGEDANRDITLRRNLGITTMRFTVDQVENDLPGVVSQIRRVAATLPTFNSWNHGRSTKRSKRDTAVKDSKPQLNQRDARILKPLTEISVT
jgi:very-short-patch-repair endonuclease